MRYSDTPWSRMLPKGLVHHNRCSGHLWLYSSIAWSLHRWDALVKAETSEISFLCLRNTYNFSPDIPEVLETLNLKRLPSIDSGIVDMSEQAVSVGEKVGIPHIDFKLPFRDLTCWSRHRGHTPCEIAISVVIWLRQIRPNSSRLTFYLTRLAIAATL